MMFVKEQMKLRKSYVHACKIPINKRTYTDKEVYDKAHPGAPISTVHHSKAVASDWKKLTDEQKQVDNNILHYTRHDRTNAI